MRIPSKIEKPAIRPTKTAAIGVAALLAFTSLSTVAQASDFGRLGIGLGVAILGKMIEGGTHSAHGRDREPGRGDRMVGRASDRDQASTRNKGSDKGNDGSDAQVAALPETGPVIEFRPDPASVEITTGIDQIETAATAFSPPPAPPFPPATAVQPAPVVAPVVVPVAPPVFAQPVQIVDEHGVIWGKVDGATANKIAQALALGMKPSQAYAALSGLPNPDTPAPVHPAPVAQPTPMVAITDQPVAPVAVVRKPVDTTSVKGVNYSFVDTIPKTLDPGQEGRASFMKPAPVPAPVAFPAPVAVAQQPVAAPASVQTAVAPVPAAAAPATGPVVAAAPTAPAADIDLGSTAAVTPDAPAAQPAAAAPVKSNLDIDL